MYLYSLNNQTSLLYDLEDIITTVHDMYDVEFQMDKFYFITKKRLNRNLYPFGHPKNTEVYNLFAPKMKSLHLNMYAFIESAYKHAGRKFNRDDIKELETLYPLFRYFRLLNNKLKHRTVDNYKIDLMSYIFIVGDTNYIDINCQYVKDDNYDTLETIMFFDFIELFYVLIEKMGIIKLERIPFKKNIFNS